MDDQATEPDSILIIDSPYGHFDLPGARFVNSAWNRGLGSFEVPTNTAAIIVFDATPDNSDSTAAHLVEGKRIRAAVENGAIFVGLTAAAVSHRFGNLLDLVFRATEETVHQQYPRDITAAEGPYLGIFSAHSHQIGSCPVVELAPELTPTEVAKHKRTGKPVAISVRLGSGLAIWLPMMGGDPASLISDVVEVSRNLIDVPASSWLETDDYWMPQLLDVKAREKILLAETESKLSELRKEEESVRAAFQANANGLLTESGSNLVNAVELALRTLGVETINVDVAEPERREEDLWLGRAQMSAPPQDTSHLAEVKSYRRGTCSDDDYAALLKYLRRRSREWSRSDLRGLLVVNHQLSRPASDRQKAFSVRQEDDARRDGIALLDTTTLFELLRRFYANGLSAVDCQDKILETTGPVSL
jgi:hypothetical protein